MWRESPSRPTKNSSNQEKERLQLGLEAFQGVEKVLPAKVTVADHYNKTAQATVKWTCASYKATTAGTYKATGTVALPSGWTGKPATFTVNITVQAAPVTSGGAVTGNK